MVREREINLLQDPHRTMETEFTSCLSLLISLALSSHRFQVFWVKT